MAEALEIRNLTKIYKRGLKRRVVALEGLNLEVDEGEIFGFVGPNGAGKSTTIKILMNLIFPTKGEVKIKGLPSSNPHARKSLGYLPENPVFYDHLTGEEFLLFTGSLMGMRERGLKDRARELLRMVGLKGAEFLQLRKYSKGMIQRLGIAQALMGDPAIVVMDEPMSGLDPIGRLEISQLISSLKKEGRTVFFSSHILHDVETICDRVGILVKGRLTFLGSISSLEKEDTSPELERRNPLKGWILRVGGDQRAYFLEKGWRVTVEGHITRVEVPSQELWNSLELVRTHNLFLYSLEKVRLSLEDLFVKEVTSGST